MANGLWPVLVHASRHLSLRSAGLPSTKRLLPSSSSLHGSAGERSGHELHCPCASRREAAAESEMASMLRLSMKDWYHFGSGKVNKTAAHSTQSGSAADGNLTPLGGIRIRALWQRMRSALRGRPNNFCKIAYDISFAARLRSIHDGCDRRTQIAVLGNEHVVQQWVVERIRVVKG